jgi:hypothetical protein
MLTFRDVFIVLWYARGFLVIFSIVRVICTCPFESLRCLCSYVFYRWMYLFSRAYGDIWYSGIFLLKFRQYVYIVEMVRRRLV